MMKDCVYQVRNNAKIAGELLRSTAASLYELKQNLVNKEWMAFLKSGALPIPEKQARDLCAAWEGWLKDADVTDGDLVFIGTRAMAKMKQLEPEDKKKVVKKLKAGEKVTEKYVDTLKEKTYTLLNGVDKDNWESVTKDLGGVNKELIASNSGFRSENKSLLEKISTLTKENEELKKKIAELEKMVAV
ncbi:hypothetical protein KR49_06895 [Synechococcus sp. KORDI-49]|nr:hypothetical protein KR49_06895 [Synechococcus sp. KORDI-49]